MNALSALIVEDSAAQREYMERLCREVGIGEISTAENGHVALNVIDAREQHFDLLICDLEMPGLDGIELIHLIASRHRHRNSGLIIVSGREQSLISAVELMATTEGLWVLGGIQKPLTEAKLMRLIEHYIRSTRRIGQAPEKVHKELISLESLRCALLEHQFVLHYQPKMTMNSGELYGVEALVRMRKLNGELVFPNDFIPLCEEQGLIDELSYEIVQMAAYQRQQWREKGLDTVISINLSAVSFDNEEFCSQLMSFIHSLGEEAKRLIFEVTETGVINDIGKALSILARLRLSGCGLSIDDYGTGYSSIKQLSQIPFSELKIDRSLISGISNRSHLQVIFESTLSMCQKLGITVVAEGIEKKSDWKYLRQQGCHVGQGYYYSPPMPSNDLYRWWQAGMPPLS
ncbi:EAL domain-containing response regulator [Vibrio navarrensis]|uniref:EAL domain-containing response regulator n=1 Tax=Vibrio navarrensis TaxID=29495 RepID=UPI00338F4FCF